MVYNSYVARQGLPSRNKKQKGETMNKTMNKGQVIQLLESIIINCSCDMGIIDSVLKQYSEYGITTSDLFN